MTARWIGDLSTCFLLDDGWAFRLKINRFQLAGKPGWQMPVSIASAVGLEVGEWRSLPCTDGSDHVLSLEHRGTALVGGAIDPPLRQLGGCEGDLAFIVLRGDAYSVVLRRRE